MGRSSGDRLLYQLTDLPVTLGTRTHAQFRVAMRPLLHAVARWLKAGQTCGVAKTEDVCQEVRKVYDALWTCGLVEDVEPTNHSAERAIRPGVLWRKGSFGSDSEAGRRFAERLLTVVATCRQQGRPLLEFLIAAGEAALQGTAAPSLLSARWG